MDDVLDALDHPVIFVFLITFAVIAMTSLLLWGAVSLHMKPVETLITHQPAIA